jgi:two-component system, OmpR family, sensor kinase
MIAELSDPNDRRRARDVEVTLKRLSGLAEKLMQLSRVDAGVSLGDRDVDLVPVQDMVVDDCAKRLDEPNRIHYVKPARATLVARMDMDAFAMVVRNLIDNAANHGAAGGRIEVRVEQGGVIHIINDGPVVPPEALAGLKRRFIRGQTPSAGAGLGLAIAETIMAQTGGRLDLFSPACGHDGGFEARLITKTATVADLPAADKTARQ